MNCFFIGHRDASWEIYSVLYREIERHIIKEHIQNFYVGAYGTFDTMAVRALGEIKQTYPDVLLFLALPYHLSVKPIALPKNFDGLYFPEGQETVPPHAAILRLNRYLIDQSDYLISYVFHISSGSYKVLQYAERREQLGQLTITRLETNLIKA